MKLIVSMCGVLLDLDSVPRNPHQVCPVCKEPLEADAVEYAFHPAENPSSASDERRQASKQQAHADVKAIRAAAIDLGDVTTLAARLSAVESRVGNTEALLTATKPA